jgi:hypothetical protein
MTHISLVFSTISRSILVTIWWQVGNCTHPHYRKPNVVPMDFQQKIKVSNPLQRKEPSPPKRLVVKDLICGKAIGCQKSL